MSGMTYLGEKLVFVPQIYMNGRISVHIIVDDGEPYHQLSTNIEALKILPDDEFCVAAWNTPDDFAAALLATGAFEPTGMEALTGHAIAPIWRLKDPSMLENIAAQREKMYADIH